MLYKLHLASLRVMDPYVRLVPRPSHRPVFDHLQYAKTEGEGLVSFIMQSKTGRWESLGMKLALCVCVSTLSLLSMEAPFLHSSSTMLDLP